MDATVFASASAADADADADLDIDADFNTCDLCDLHRDAVPAGLRVLPPVFREFGAAARFSGPVATLRCFEDNTLLKAAVDAPGNGRVLVVDGGASLRRALLGGNLAAAAVRNGWAGVLIDGCVRDVAELAACNIGIRALAAVPMPPRKRNEGDAGVAVCVQGIWVRPGDWLYADADGILISDVPLMRGLLLASPLSPLPPLSLLPPLP